MSSNGKKKPAGGKKKKAAKKASKPSFLKRLLKRDGEDKKSRGDSGKSTASEKKKALTPLEKSIAEIRQLQKVGERDPERLATQLANILSKEKQKQDEAKEKFDAMVWDIVHNDEKSGEDSEADDSQSDAAAPEDDGDGPSPGGPGANPN